MTAKFGFDPRKNGDGTHNESIMVPKWSVSYEYGRLIFKGEPPVNGIVSVYSATGALEAQSMLRGNPEVPIPALSQGLHAVSINGSRAVKIWVQNGYGSSAPQPAVEPVVTYAAFADATAPVGLRAGGIKGYLNVTAGNSTIPIKIADVKELYFTADNSLVYTTKNGNTYELKDYKVAVFSDTQAPVPTSGWDMERTLQYGGCTYAMRAVGVQNTIVFSAVHKDGIAFQSKFIDGTDPRYQWFPNANINSAMWDAAKANSGSRLSLFVSTTWDYGITYPTILISWPVIDIIQTSGERGSSNTTSWSFNGNTNLIPTTVVQNADGSITMSCKDINGKTQTHTFTNP